MTRNEIAARQMHLWRGIFPLMITTPKPTGLLTGDAWIQDVDDRVQKAIDTAIQTGFSKKGDTMVLITGWRGGSGNTNTLRVIKC